MSEDGGIPMIEEDKVWILEQFESKVNGIKLDMIKDIDNAIGKLPCEVATEQRQTHALKIQSLEQTLEDADKFAEKLQKMKDNQGIVGLKKWQLFVASTAVIVGANIPFSEIIKMLK